MPFKVREILLVATPYDAFSITRDGTFFDQIYGEFLQLNLYSAPRITSVFSHKEALREVQNKNYQMVIVMAGLDKLRPRTTAEAIKDVQPDLPVLLLLNNNSDIHFFKNENAQHQYSQGLFVWNGDPKIFLAMTKLVEDFINVKNDTQLAVVRIILFV